MTALEGEILKSHPISHDSPRTYSVEERTQGSVNMENMVDEINSFYMKSNILTSLRVTREIHDQKYSKCCTSIAVTSALRAAQRRYLSKFDTTGFNETLIRELQGDIRSEFAHRKCLILFVGCVSPRSLDGMIQNSISSA